MKYLIFACFFALSSYANDRIKDRSYWYEDSDIRKILKNRLKDSYVGTSLPFESKGLLKDVVKDAINESKKGHPSVIPINLHGNHWTGLVIKRNNNNKLEIFYNDPFGKPITNEENSKLLFEVIKEIDPSATIKDFQIRQQNDGSSCGPFTVENLITISETDDDIEERLRNIKEPEKLRIKHFDIFKGNFSLEKKFDAKVFNLSFDLMSDISDILAEKSTQDELLGFPAGENGHSQAVWIHGLFSFGRVKEDKISKKLISIGYDFNLDEDIKLGLAYSFASLKFKEEAQGHIGSIYGSLKSFPITSSISYGEITTIAKTKGTIFTGYVGINYPISLGEKFFFKPQVAGKYDQLKLKKIGKSIKVAIKPGISSYLVIEADDLSIIPEMGFFVDKNVLNKNTVLITSFPAVTYEMKGTLRLLKVSSLDAEIGYEYKFGQSLKMHSGFIKLKANF
jgi:Ulp1 protease family, C-terminal catalytic domain